MAKGEGEGELKLGAPLFFGHMHIKMPPTTVQKLLKKKDPVIGIRPATPTSVSPFSFGVQVSQFLRFKAWFLELLAKGI